MKRATITSVKNREIIDITDMVNGLLHKQQKKNGICHLFLTHTTAAITAVYLDPESELNMLDLFEVMMPISEAKETKDTGYFPTRFLPHIPDHIIASFVGSFQAVPYHNKELILGNFQRIVLVELNGPRTREVLVTT